MGGTIINKFPNLTRNMSLQITLPNKIPAGVSKQIRQTISVNYNICPKEIYSVSKTVKIESWKFS